MAQGRTGRGVDPELDRLRAEAARARDELRVTLRAARDRAKNPFEYREKVRDHPWITLGAAAGTGMMLGHLLVRPPTPNGQPGSTWIDRLLDTAIRTARPVVEDFVKEAAPGILDRVMGDSGESGETTAS